MVAAPLCKPYGAVTPLVLRVWMGASSVAVCQSNCTVTLHPVPFQRDTWTCRYEQWLDRTPMEKSTPCWDAPSLSFVGLAEHQWSFVQGWNSWS